MRKNFTILSKDSQGKEVSELSAEVDLQSLLDHTANRILESQRESDTLPTGVLQNSDVVLIGKWGFDGSSGHSQYK